jgi:Uma2 family endonuclease
MVFEYLSPSTTLYNRTTKADTYLALGVRELWLIDSVTCSIEVRYARHDGKVPMWETRIYIRRAHAKSRVLKGWEVSVAELFDGLV